MVDVKPFNPPPSPHPHFLSFSGERGARGEKGEDGVGQRGEPGPIGPMGKIIFALTQMMYLDESHEN